MDIVTRERLRNEVKALAFRRTSSKRRARQLQQRANKLYRQVYAEQAAGTLEGNYWNDKRYSIASESSTAAFHLTNDLAGEARHVNIAYALLRGTPYRKVEQKCRVAPNAERVLNLIHKFCGYRVKRDWTLERVKELLA